MVGPCWVSHTAAEVDICLGQSSGIRTTVKSKNKVGLVCTFQFSADAFTFQRFPRLSKEVCMCCRSRSSLHHRPEHHLGRCLVLQGRHGASVHICACTMHTSFLLGLDWSALIGLTGQPKLKVTIAVRSSNWGPSKPDIIDSRPTAGFFLAVCRLDRCLLRVSVHQLIPGCWLDGASFALDCCTCG